MAATVHHDGEIAVMEDAGYLEVAGRYVSIYLNAVLQAMQAQGRTLDDPSVLGAISAPVLLLHGSDTLLPWFTASAQYVADHVPSSRIREIPSAGHGAPLTHPEALAQALIEFFEPARK
jgi:pimeloyl-ACP methyl ester carboxylesterase